MSLRRVAIAARRTAAALRELTDAAHGLAAARDARAARRTQDIALALARTVNRKQAPEFIKALRKELK
jgi:hypothetical protein